MRLQFINSMVEDEILAKNILNYNGQILLKKGVKLNKTYINKLNNLGVFCIYIEDDRLSDIDGGDEEVFKLKQSSLKSIYKITRNISMENYENIQNDLESVQNMVEYIIDIKDVNKNIYAIKTYDNYTYMHSLETSVMTTFLGSALNYNKEFLKELVLASVLHDIGKIKIPHSIINKKGKLTKEEFEIMKSHTIYGKEILSKIKWIPEKCLYTVEQHHEKIDGTGYPYGIGENEILDYTKIVSICDVYDAINSDRCYRRKFSPNNAYELILGGSGTFFDEKVVKKFKETFSVYPLGCKVQLSNGDEGYVIRQNKGFPDKPVVRVFENEKSSIYYEVDLSNTINLVIKKVV